jgi:hypothetical protein
LSYVTCPAATPGSIPGKVTHNGFTVCYRVVNILKSPTTIQFRSEFSTDKQTWTPTATGTESRLSDWSAPLSPTAQV